MCRKSEGSFSLQWEDEFWIVEIAVGKQRRPEKEAAAQPGEEDRDRYFEHLPLAESEHVLGPDRNVSSQNRQRELRNLVEKFGSNSNSNELFSETQASRDCEVDISGQARQQIGDHEVLSELDIGENDAVAEVTNSENELQGNEVEVHASENTPVGDDVDKVSDTSWSETVVRNSFQISNLNRLTVVLRAAVTSRDELAWEDQNQHKEASYESEKEDQGTGDPIEDKGKDAWEMERVSDIVRI